MMHVKRIIIILTLTFSYAPLYASAVETNYEKPKCVGTGKPPGDIVLKCGESPTLQKLVVSVKESKRSGLRYEANTIITNKNNYPVVIKSLVAAAKNSEGSVVGLCSQGIDFPLSPEESKEAMLKCQFLIVNPGKGAADIQSIVIKASPWK